MSVRHTNFHNKREPILPHKVIIRPWAKIGVDSCQLHGRMLLIVCDYFSNYLEVECLPLTTSRSVARVLASLFARHGIPNVVVSDNYPQFASTKFASFVKKRNFEHVTSSPHYAQSNGKAKNAIKTVRPLFKKCREDGTSEFLALLDWQNTPSEGMGISPSQRLMGRWCKTLLPMATLLFQPRYSMAHDRQAIVVAKAKQGWYYNRHTHPLIKQKSGEGVRICLPGEKSWTSGICEGSAGSYNVCVGANTYRHNRRDLKSSPLQAPPSEVDVDGIIAVEKSISSSDIVRQLSDSKLPTPEPEVLCDLPAVSSPAEGVSLGVRCSQHERKVNIRLCDYITGRNQL